MPETPFAQESGGSMAVSDEATEFDQEETTSAVVTIQLYGNGNGGEPSVTILTESANDFLRKDGTFPSAMERSLTAGIWIQSVQYLLPLWMEAWQKWGRWIFMQDRKN